MSAGIKYMHTYPLRMLGSKCQLEHTLCNFNSLSSSDFYLESQLLEEAHLNTNNYGHKIIIKKFFI